MNRKLHELRKLAKFQERLAGALQWQRLGILVVIDTLIALLLFFILAKQGNWFSSFVQVFSCAHAIGTSIYFLVMLSGVIEIKNLWKRLIGLTGIFVLGGLNGTLIVVAVNDAVLEIPLPAESYESLLATNIFLSLFFGALVNSYFALRDKLESTAAKLAEKEINEQRLLQLKTKAELEALRAKVNPHFLFNTLNSIASLIPVDPAKAEAMVQKLAHLLRFTLDASHHEMMKLVDELQVIREYLAIEKIRLGERLSYEINMDEALANVLIPGLLLQPLVENSVKHGIAPTKTGGQIALKCHADGKFCHIEISDTGQGFDHANTEENFGLGSVRERLALNYGENYEFQIKAEQGVQIFLRLPYEIQNDTH